jgi:hypothetical protein
MRSSRNKDLEMLGRRESSFISNEDPFLIWQEIISAKQSLELKHKVFGKPSQDDINNLYKEFLDKIKKLRQDDTRAIKK